MSLGATDHDRVIGFIDHAKVEVRTILFAGALAAIAFDVGDRSADREVGARALPAIVVDATDVVVVAQHPRHDGERVQQIGADIFDERQGSLGVVTGARDELEALANLLRFVRDVEVGADRLARLRIGHHGDVTGLGIVRHAEVEGGRLDADG